MYKKRKIILLFVVIISTVAAIYFSLLQDKKDNILAKVPNNAKSVLVVDLQALSSKLLFDELTSGSKNAGKLAKMMPDTLAEIDWLASGISLSEKAILFSTEDITGQSIRLHLLLRVSKAKKFNSFIDSLSKNLNLESINEKVLWSSNFNSSIAWNDDFVLLSFFSKNKKQEARLSKDILLLNKEGSIMTDNNFMKKQTAGFDILLYNKPYTRYPKKQNKFIRENIESMVSLIHFNDGELKLESELIPIGGSLLEKLFTVYKKPLPNFSILDSSILEASLDIEAQAFFQITDKLVPIKFNNKKIPLLAAWDGRARLSLNGSKLIENEYISYEYDDDFNKVERKSVTKDKIWDIRTILGVDENSLDSVLSHVRINKSNNDTLLFKGSNLIIKKTDGSYLCYNRYLDLPKIKENTKLDNISIEFDYDKLRSIIKNYEKNTTNFLLDNKMIESFDLHINRNTFIDISAGIYFKDKKENAFFSISKMFIEATDTTHLTKK